MTQDRLEDIKRRRVSIPGWDEDIDYLLSTIDALKEAGNFLYEAAMKQVAEQKDKIELLKGVIKSSAEYCKTCIHKKGIDILSEQLADLKAKAGGEGGVKEDGKTNM